MMSLRDAKGYDDLPQELKDVSEKLDRAEANKVRLMALPKLDAKPVATAHQFGVDFQGEPDDATLDVCWSILSGAVPQDAPLLGYTRSVEDGRHRLDVYLA